MTEEWRDIPGWVGLYQVSNLGRVRSLDRCITRSDGQQRNYRGGVMTPGVMPTGHLCLVLSSAGYRWTTQVHRLVALAFIGPRPPGMEVRHLDGDPANNLLTNLRYGTRSQNRYDRVRHGVDHNAKKTHCKQGHPFTPENTIWRTPDRTGRRCRQCKAISQRRRLQRKASA